VDAGAAPSPLLLLTGPTGSGKSELALQLAAALQPQRPVEIISVDSVLIYRGMDIGSAKPGAAARAQVPHHLIDILDPAQSYSAGEFVRDARAAIAAIRQRGHWPLLVGGTMLYLRALYQGLAALHAELARVDPQAAARIARNDAQRIQRALEVQRLTGLPISHWQQRTDGAQDEFRWLRYALIPAAGDDWRGRLAARFEAMLQHGLLAEVRALHARGDLSEQHPSIRAVGYRQLWGYCEGRCSLDEAVRLAIIATRQLAKRQLTWLRREPTITTLPAHTVGLAAIVADSIHSTVGA
jgi:tRNA dimethylallyltransferase